MIDRDPAYIYHNLECIGDIERYIGGKKNLFMQDDMVRNATLRQLQIMSESCTRLSEAAQAIAIEIDWKQIRGFRNVVAHDYLGDINLSKAWDVIEYRLPELKKAMQTILQQRYGETL